MKDTLLNEDVKNISVGSSFSSLFRIYRKTRITYRSRKGCCTPHFVETRVNAAVVIWLVVLWASEYVLEYTRFITHNVRVGSRISLLCGRGNFIVIRKPLSLCPRPLIVCPKSFLQTNIKLLTNLENENTFLTLCPRPLIVCPKSFLQTSNYSQIWRTRTPHKPTTGTVSASRSRCDIISKVSSRTSTSHRRTTGTRQEGEVT